MGTSPRRALTWSSFAGFPKAIDLTKNEGSGPHVNRRLYYRRPASVWTEALPIGNGRLGAMVFGGIEVERLQLNEDTLWSGPPGEWDNPKALEALPKVRELIFQGKYAEADALTREMMGPFTQSYLPLGDLWIIFRHGDLARSYERSLDLSQGVTATAYRIGKATYRREAFVSYPDQVLVFRMETDEPIGLHFSRVPLQPAQVRNPDGGGCLCDGRQGSGRCRAQLLGSGSSGDLRRWPRWEGVAL